MRHIRFVDSMYASVCYFVRKAAIKLLNFVEIIFFKRLNNS